METLFFAPEVAAKRDIRAVDGLPQSVSQTIRGGSSAIRKLSPRNRARRVNSARLVYVSAYRAAAPVVSR